MTLLASSRGPPPATTDDQTERVNAIVAQYLRVTTITSKRAGANYSLWLSSVTTLSLRQFQYLSAAFTSIRVFGVGLELDSAIPEATAVGEERKARNVEVRNEIDEIAVENTAVVYWTSLLSSLMGISGPHP